MATGQQRSRAYSFFRPDLRDAAYAAGDIYSPDIVALRQAEWDIHNTIRYPYLKYVKDLSTTWPHLRLLADFMEVTTTPLRWDYLRRNPTEREERAKRTNVTRLEYFNDGHVIPMNYTSPGELTRGLQEVQAEGTLFRLFVVEDLSRDVIEALGHELDVEPDFFREHIFEYAWYNIRDRWMDPPNLNLYTKQQRWFQIRFVTARYYQTSKSFLQGIDEAKTFNVLRRPDDDQNNNAVWDNSDAIVGVTRTRASFWMKKADPALNSGAVGVLLLDPTIKEGKPIWNGYKNWEPTPVSQNSPVPQGPPRDSIFNDFVYWAQRPEVFNKSGIHKSNVHIPIQVLLHLVCAEWIMMSSYIKTRLGQIEWEISVPEHFLSKGSRIDNALIKLSFWRRVVPLYREMLGETLERIFNFPCHDKTGLIATQHTTSAPDSRITTDTPLPPNAPAVSDTTSATAPSSSLDNTPSPDLPSVAAPVCQCDIHQPNSLVKQGPITSFRDDFLRCLSNMIECQQKIDRSSSVATSTISIADSRRGLSDNQNVARLTWLATLFIPLSYVATLFSMQADITSLGETMKWYFAASIPASIIAIGIALSMTLFPWQEYAMKVSKDLAVRTAGLFRKCFGGKRRQAI